MRTELLTKKQMLITDALLELIEFGWRTSRGNTPKELSEKTKVMLKDVNLLDSEDGFDFNQISKSVLNGECGDNARPAATLGIAMIAKFQGFLRCEELDSYSKSRER